MALSDIDRNRSQPLQPATVQRLVHAWNTFGAQYSLFTDAPSLSDATIVAWMDSAESVDKLRDPLFRQDSIGMMQGLSGLWQIFLRQGSVPAAKADQTLAQLVAPFPAMKNSRDLFFAGRNGINLLLNVADATKGPVQDRMLGLLAGGPRLDDSEARVELIQEERRIV